MKPSKSISLIPWPLLFAFFLGCQSRTQLMPGEGTLQLSGGNVWYRIDGQGSKTPLVMLHGGPGAPSYYLNPLAALANERPVIFFDQPGCGRSDLIEDTNTLSVSFFVSQLEELRQALGLDAFYLYGQSWGGTLAVEYYLAHPKHVKALILSSPLLSTERWIADTDYLISTLPDTIQAAIRLHEAAGSFDHAEYQQAMQVFYEQFAIRKQPWSEDVNNTFANLAGNVYYHMWGPSEFTATGLLKDYDITGRLGEISVPTLYIAGEFDEARPDNGDIF
jgi:proline iminopeptidase